MFVEGSRHAEVVCTESRVDQNEPPLCVGKLPPSCPIFRFKFGITEVARNRNSFGVNVRFTLRSEIR